MWRHWLLTDKNVDAILHKYTQNIPDTHLYEYIFPLIIKEKVNRDNQDESTMILDDNIEHNIANKIISMLQSGQEQVGQDAWQLLKLATYHHININLAEVSVDKSFSDDLKRSLYEVEW